MFKKYLDYLKDNPRGYWFKAKLFGWGWTPATWQGWLTTTVYVGLLIILALRTDKYSTDEAVFFSFFSPLILLTGIFIWIAWKKGEKPAWHWGWPKK